ncbi:endonuclease NucS domain-containing protein [Patulibacter americanus]|uniref:endonuclease NucS domain-containing protein n=1 Tax=Patulibacter americanus TaxID=588672 RepID=UPI0003B60DCB|nr:endonuclease NucS domain-containing protein [Patulibacter americanus]
MRLIVARCEVRYSGRLEALLPEALRLLMIKSDGSVMVHADTGGFKPQNWMTPPTVIELERGGVPVPDEVASGYPDLGLPTVEEALAAAAGGPSAMPSVGPVDSATLIDAPAPADVLARTDAVDPDAVPASTDAAARAAAAAVVDEPLTKIVVRKRAGSTEDRLDIVISEVVSDVFHDMGEAAALEKSGVERELQELLADAPHHCGEGFRLVRREWPTDIGPVDLMCRDDEDGWVAVEIKRVGTIDAVEQLSRYLERMRDDPGMGDIKGVLAAQSIKPQARVLAESRGLGWVEVDLDVLRGDREPALRLFDL